MEDKSKKPNPKRRAIIQGSLAAPVVLTVSSAGAQTAVTSMTAKLAAVKKYQPDKSEYFTGSPDKWLRRSVLVDKLKYKGVGAQDVKEDWFYLDREKSLYIRLSDMAWMNFGEFLPERWEKTGTTAPRYLLVWVDPITGSQSITARVEPGGDIAATCSVLSFTCPQTG